MVLFWKQFLHQKRRHRQLHIHHFKRLIFISPSINGEVRPSVHPFVRSLLSVTESNERTNRRTDGLVEFTSRVLVKVSLSKYIFPTTQQKVFIFELWVP